MIVNNVPIQRKIKKLIASHLQGAEHVTFETNVPVFVLSFKRLLCQEQHHRVHVFGQIDDVERN